MKFLRPSASAADVGPARSVHSNVRRYGTANDIDGIKTGLHPQANRAGHVGADVRVHRSLGPLRGHDQMDTQGAAHRGNSHKLRQSIRELIHQDPEFIHHNYQMRHGMVT